jgi:peptide/nickel transport system substrate-binding protein
VRTDLDIGNLDPANRSNSCDEAILRATLQGLVTFKPGSLDWELDAAKSITQVSDTEITFELNPGQMFTDGHGEMTADDVKFSFERYITPDASGALPSFSGDFSALDKVEVTSTYTGRILLKNPAPAFWVLGLCDAGGVILSRKSVEALGDGIKTKVVGTGPYVLAEWQAGQQIVLARNPGYIGQNPGSFDKITIKPISDPRAALLSLLAKEVAWSEVETTDEPQVMGVDGIVPFATPRIDYTWIGMNVEKGALADIRVRQAIRLAIDVDMIIAGAYQGTVEPARALLAPSLLPRRHCWPRPGRPG